MVTAFAILAMFFTLGLPLKVLSTKKLIKARLGEYRTIYINVDTPNLGFLYWEAQCKKHPLAFYSVLFISNHSLGKEKCTISCIPKHPTLCLTLSPIKKCFVSLNFFCSEFLFFPLQTFSFQFTPILSWYILKGRVSQNIFRLVRT